MINQRVQRILLLLLLSFLLGACDQIEGIDETDVSQIEEAEFYNLLRETVVDVRMPVLFIGLINLLGGWKLGRFGLAMNGFVIGGLMIYTYLNNADIVEDENTLRAMGVVGGLLTAILAFFLYNLMALLIGGAIGTTLMGGTWLQVAEQVPPQVLVFLTTFASAMLMFVVFRLFLVAFSAVIGAVMLMMAVPFEPLWVIPMVGLGILIQSGIAWWINDDIFRNLRGDLRTAVGESFGEVLGPFGLLRERQKETYGSAPVSRQPQYGSPQQPPQYNPPPQQQQRYNAPPQQPAQYSPPPQPSSAPRYNPPPQPQQPPQYNPPPQQYQPPAQQAPYNPPLQYQAPVPPYQPPVQPDYASLHQTQQSTRFQPELLLLQLNDGRVFPLNHPQITVGRSADNLIVVNDPEVSGRHLIFALQPDGLMVWDNNSTNGSYLNGRPLQGSHRLTMQDVIQIGAVTLRLIRRGDI